MVLFLEVLNGPLEGQKFRAAAGLTIGRTQGQIRLDEDVKASGLHAKVDLDNKEQLILLDQGSSNGLILNNRRVKKVALMPGVTFRVGTTQFQVVELGEEEAQALAPELSWKEKLKELLMDQPGENREIEGTAQTFTPPLMLEFVQGLQAETIMTLAYGPRQAGHAHLDIDLMDPDAPEACFELAPGPGLALLRDRTLGKLTLNGVGCAEEEIPLQEGDTIGIGGTLIRVRYL